ncbi:MAG: hypothetical protein II453_05325 [Alphaproteobacteria bacterium]|nr:hypothetical protein [Alphaproteobacteria bacterium]
MTYRKGLNGRTGKSTTKLYSIWNNMRVRCNNPEKYKRYAGRGIKVCESWDKSFLEFEKWAIRNGWKDSKDRNTLSIDRINNDGNYCPENCRIVDMRTQARNRSNNTHYTIDGKKYLFCELCDKYHLSTSVLNMRLSRNKNIPLDEVLKKPVRKYTKRS